jgi:hypothetical protein
VKLSRGGIQIGLEFRGHPTQFQRVPFWKLVRDQITYPKAREPVDAVNIRIRPDPNLRSSEIASGKVSLSLQVPL